jgi:hypothetical protein
MGDRGSEARLRWLVAVGISTLAMGVGSVIVSRRNARRSVEPRPVSRTAAADPPVGDRIRGLLALVEASGDELNDDVQGGLATAVGLLLDIQRMHAAKQQDELVDGCETAIRALLARPPKLELAKKITARVEDGIIAARSQAAWIVGGLTATILAIILGLVLVWLLFREGFVDWVDLTLAVPGPWLITTGIVGALGSIVSLMLRVNVFDQIRGMKRSVLFLTGLFKPLVGGVFAMFLYVALRSGLIPFDQDANAYVYLVLSFVAGFSERLVPDVAQNIAAPYRFRASKRSSGTERSAGAGARVSST